MVLLTKLEIQSYSDVITNSSSELFISKKTENVFSKDEIQRLINEHFTAHYWKGSYDDLRKLTPKERLNWNTSSGDGGTHEVIDSHDRYKKWIENNKREECKLEDVMKAIPYDTYIKYIDYRGEDYIYFDIDHSACATINFILENFNVTENSEYGYYEIDPETKQILKLLTEEEYNKLPEERRSECY